MGALVIYNLNSNFTPAPLISFLTVNFRQPEVTLQLLQSLQYLTYPQWECIVVNNDRHDPELEAAIKNFANIKYISTDSNLGFAGGNNAGLPHCKGEYVYFINNDTEVDPGLLEPMVNCFKQNEGVGMVSSKIIFDPDRETLQYAGATELNPYTMRNRSIGYGEKDRGQYDFCKPTGFVHGASMMVPMEVIRGIGPMYEEYFLYYEEYDWCQRIRNAGYRIFYCGESKIYHKESISTGVNSPFKTYFLTRNRLLFARRNYSGLTWLINFAYFSLLALPVHLCKNIVKGNFALAKAMLKGYIWNFNHQAHTSDNRD